jgi:hypothetical protein
VTEKIWKLNFDSRCNFIFDARKLQLSHQIIAIFIILDQRVSHSESESWRNDLLSASLAVTLVATRAALGTASAVATRSAAATHDELCGE